MRAFIAIDFDESIRRALADLQDALRRRAGKLAWVAPDNLHLTIKFLGEIEPSQAEAVSMALNDVAAATTPFEILLHGVGLFPPRGLARVLWVGLEDGIATPGALAAMQQDCEGRLAEMGFAREVRPFQPHLTLARNKTQFDRDLRRSFEHGADFHAGPQRVEALTLYESRLSAGGPTYREVSRHTLAGS